MNIEQYIIYVVEGINQEKDFQKAKKALKQLKEQKCKKYI